MIPMMKLFLRSLMWMLWGEKENKIISDLLEALAAYTEDIQGYYDNREVNIFIW